MTTPSQASLLRRVLGGVEEASRLPAGACCMGVWALQACCCLAGPRPGGWGTWGGECLQLWGLWGGGGALGDAALLGRGRAALLLLVLLLVLVPVGLLPVGRLAVMLLSCLGAREGGEVVQGRPQVQQGPAGPAGLGHPHHGAQQGSQPLESGQVQLSLLLL